MKPVQRGVKNRSTINANIYAPVIHGNTAVMRQSFAQQTATAAALPVEHAPARVPNKPRPQAEYAIRQAGPAVTLGMVLHKLGVGVSIIVLLALAVLVVSRASQIAYKNGEIQDIKQEIAALEKDNEWLVLQLNMANPIEEIMRTAEQDLDMSYPESEQVRKLTVDLDASGELAQAAPQEEAESNPGFWSFLWEFLQ